ncbi:MAG: Hsp20/alpha crystallin family protein [Azospirillaceae bacterium]|nr:Hsp20/alpha crystallin family protein [Azospirillaceae bacterium]
MQKRDPRALMWAEAAAFIDRAGRLHRRFFQPGAPGTYPCWEPAVDIFESPDGLVIQAALPGVSSREVEVIIDGATLVIVGERRLPAACRHGAIHRLEIPYGRFERHITLMAGSFELVRRELADGFLNLTLKRRPDLDAAGVTRSNTVIR